MWILHVGVVDDDIRKKVEQLEKQGWKDLNPPGASEANLVDSTGRLYAVITDFERSFSCVERIARFVLGLLAVMSTLGLALLAQSVRDLCIAEKAVLSMRIYFDRLSAQEIQKIANHTDKEEVWLAMDPRAIAQLNLSELSATTLDHDFLANIPAFKALFVKIEDKDLLEMLPKMKYSWQAKSLTDRHIEFLERVLRTQTDASWQRGIFDRHVESVNNALVERLKPEFHSAIFAYLSPKCRAQRSWTPEQLAENFSKELLDPQREGALRKWIFRENLPSTQLQLLSASNGFRTELWELLTEEQRREFNFSQLSAASVTSFFAAIEQGKVTLDQFSQEQLQQIPAALLSQQQKEQLQQN